MSSTIETNDILTLEEAAAFLRVPVESALRSAAHEGMPGRCIDGQWRFTKSGLTNWLQRKSNKEILLSQAGAMADDESWPEVRKWMNAQAGRPEIVEG